MKTHPLFTLSLLAVALIGGSACRSTNAVERTAASPCEIALATHEGDAKIDAEIAKLQREIRANARPQYGPALVEKLGWSFIDKARASFDPGYYKLAEQCGFCMEAKAAVERAKAEKAKAEDAGAKVQAAERSSHAASLLLRGHALHSMHRFAEAEKLARELIVIRTLAFDYGLLGDVLMEQGKLDEAIYAYQQMMEQKPGPQAYARAAHVRWLKGDLEGARTLMRLAAQSAGQGDPDAAAWAWSRLALFELQAGNAKEGLSICDLALELRKDYAPALLARGRILLAQNKAAEAVGFLQKAASINRLPEYQWTLADALRSAGRADDAAAIETALAANGSVDDPRTYAVYLATRGERAETALRLAEEEIKARRDVYTLDALAWAQAAQGDAGQAWKTIQSALTENTQDARFFLHAAVIASQAGDRRASRNYAAKAAKIESMLLPAEKNRLKELRNS
jgi:tetratricopeptide (TPR) repeat protein